MKSIFPDLVHGIAVRPVFPGQKNVDTVLPKPFDQIHKTCIDPQDIGTECLVLLLKLKCCPLALVAKYSGGMMAPLFLLIV